MFNYINYLNVLVFCLLRTVTNKIETVLFCLDSWHDPSKHTRGLRAPPSGYMEQTSIHLPKGGNRLQKVGEIGGHAQNQANTLVRWKMLSNSKYFISFVRQ